VLVECITCCTFYCLCDTLTDPWNVCIYVRTYVFRRTSGVKGLNCITDIRFLGEGKGGQRPALFKGLKIFLRVKCDEFACVQENHHAGMWSYLGIIN
jgi:hypothetical protein